MITVNATMSQLIKIGHQGENKAVQVAFDLTPFQAAFQGGYPQLVVRRPCDQSGYPVALIVDGSKAIWIVSASDTEKAGHGQCELQWFVGDALAKSDKYNFLIYSSIPGDADPPDVPSKAWYEKILSDIGDLSDLDTEDKENLVAAINEARQTGGGGAGGTSDHQKLSNRDAADQHPIAAITGLKAALDGKQPAGRYLTDKDLDSTITMEGKAADAKAVGDRLSALSKEIANLGGGTGGGLLTVETITIGEESGGDDSGTEETVAVTGLTLDYTSANLNIGDTLQLACEVLPSNATNTGITWESSDNGIATVEDGLITAVASGDVTITAKSVENNAITATCTVNVAEAESGGDDNTGETTGGKVQFTTLERTDGFFKADGTVASLSNTYHVSFPYTEGMFVSTGTNGGWNINTYSPVVVLDNGAYSAPAVTKADSTISVGGKIVTQYTAKLSGYSASAIVYVSFLAGGTKGSGLETNMDKADIYYYIPGGEA